MSGAQAFVGIETAQVFRVRGRRRFFTREAAYLAAARRRAHELAGHHRTISYGDGSPDDECDCRVCGWRMQQEKAGGAWDAPLPQIERYARKMAAHDRAKAAGREETRG